MTASSLRYAIVAAVIVVISCKRLDVKRVAAVKTDEVILNADNSVTAGATLLDLGEGGIADHGHCWAKNPDSTPADHYSSLGVPDGTGAFQSTIPPLESGTWYIRAYLAVETDPGPTYLYGEESEIVVSGFPCGTSLTDSRDGNTYSTVQIGSQCWMASNLNYGTLITSNDPSDNQTDNTIAEKYCYGDNTSSCLDEGGLYQWGEAMNYAYAEGSQGICPMGWHIPTDEEWKTLEIYLGMSSAGADSISWRGTDQGTTLKLQGSAAFGAGGTGYRKSDGGFYGNPQYGYFWSSTENGTQAWVRGVLDSEGRVYRNTIGKSYGLCIRCLKD